MDHKMMYEQLKGQVKLPNFAIPKRYDLKLKPDLSACTFAGSVEINLDIVQETQFLVLNALELVINEVYFRDSHQREYRPSDVTVDNEDEILVLAFADVLPLGEGILGVNFSGILNDHLIGFYRSTFVVGGEKKNMAVTQFEAADARRCFPCWDEPALKATFKITMEVPSEFTALSNMPVIDEKLNGHLKTVSFDETPTMSTYLVAFVVGLFDYVEDITSDGIKVRAYCPVGESEKGKLALDIAVRVLDLYKKFFSMPYTLPKLDMVAIPDFCFGAMENYGLITFRENELLHDELQSAAVNKQRLAIVVAHEVAHQWFGNLVTMEWWTHLWLNEGFATWVSYLATDCLYPEWKIWNQFLQLTVGGLQLDALEESHPIEVEVLHARSINEVADAISYKKGSAVVRMLQDYLGDDIFQRSLAAYIKKYAWKNAKTEDLWDVLSEVSGIQVRKLMDTWTKQMGYPVLYVKSKNQIIEFEQSQFLSSGSHGQKDWIVPVTLCIGSYKRRKNLLIETKSGNLDISSLCCSSDGSARTYELNQEKWDDEQLWVKLNVGQTGFYRVKYDDVLAARLMKAIEANLLSSTDRFGILDDSYALFEASDLSLSSLLSMMNVYRKEIDYVALSRLIDISYNIVKISSEAIPYSLNELKQFFKNLLSANKLGWETISGESHLNVLLRGELLTALVVFGHSATQKEALRRFHIFLGDRNTPLLPADLRRVAYVAVMQIVSAKSRTGFESLLNVYREADAVQEKARVLRTLASCPDSDIVLEVLNFLLSDEVRDQDIIYGLSGISSEGREIAWRWLKDNWDLIADRWGSGGLLTQFIREIVTPFCSWEKADEIEAFFATRVTHGIARTLKQSIEQVRIKARLVQNVQHEQSVDKLIRQLAFKE
ncbi:aminopeptidase M1-like isoform X2 [Telopea speciosissima]|uniref:aminopeptidase M1-like isoform X2 n=1 Tax=Telopea speciosissima TaxID=54955 RepID=UPI001CC5BD8B|nr:aminopeptidase M1-like isoform X2 [Telopea speciosissima]